LLTEQFHRQFTLAFIWFCQGRTQLGDVVTLLGSAIERLGSRFDRDADLLLAQATLWETLAGLRGDERPSPRGRRLAMAPIVAVSGVPSYKSPEGICRECVRVLEAVLRLSPDLDEARVRLAHVRIALGECEEAVSVLGPIEGRPVADEDTKRVAYLADLLRGRALLDLGRPAAALASFAHAASLCPRCGIPLLARSQVLRVVGDLAGAEAAVRQVLARGTEPPCPDPWRDYPAGQWWRLSGLLDRMLAEARA
jgi:hypothetical protein